MTRIELTFAERDLLAALCDAAWEYEEAGPVAMLATLKELTPANFEELEALTYKFTTPDAPPSQLFNKTGRL
jgi:hypothetical protein